MNEYEHSLTIQASPQVVFEFVSMWQNLPASCRRRSELRSAEGNRYVSTVR